jgi:hypothetical protein
MRTRTVGGLACVVFALAALLAPTAQAEIVDRVMAVVGSQVVTLSDVRAAETFRLSLLVVDAANADVLSSLVDRQLALSEVERYSAPDPDRAVVAAKFAEIRAAFPSAAEFERALARTAMTEGRLRSIVADNLRIESYLEQRFAAAALATPDEVQRYYREHPSEFTRDGRLAAFDEVQSDAQQRATAQRKAALIADWLDRLRRHGVVSAGRTP